MTYDGYRIINARVVTPDNVIDDSGISIMNGRISSVGNCRDHEKYFQTIDAKGGFLLPGFIDMHSDAIEKEIEPRPGSLLPVEIAVSELDKKLAASGITTMYHSLSFSDKKLEILRTVDMVDNIIQGICNLKPSLLVNTKIHARYEITSIEPFMMLKHLIENKLVDLVSIMDHTPGQGQFTTIDQFKNYYGPRFFAEENKAMEVMNNLQAVEVSEKKRNAEATAKVCLDNNIPLASHDDDTVDKIEFIRNCGAVISEFPISLAAAEAAVKNSIYVAVGAPNIVRGRSHNGNLAAEEIIKLGYGTIVCSDYIPSTMLHAAFSLYKKQTADIVTIAKLFSTNAAKALRLQNTGAIVEGYAADLIIVDTSLSYPRISKTFVQGKEVYSSCLK